MIKGQGAKRLCSVLTIAGESSPVKVVFEIRRYGLAAICCGLALAVAWPLDAPTSCFSLQSW